ncbi:YchJ family protein [Breznakiellaceae bacterium SP9]
MKPCPCGSGLDYSVCCEPIIKNTRNPLTAEALMRARYSAYVEHEIQYILNTCIRESKAVIDEKQTRDWSEKSKWLGLTIIACEKGGLVDEEGTVEFEAKYETNGLRDVHHEKAKFKKKLGRWMYSEGEIIAETIVRSGPKIGRNEPCPCGSGKKYKNCCDR